MRSDVVRGAVLAVFVAIAACTSDAPVSTSNTAPPASGGGAPAARPNVIVIVTDDQVVGTFGLMPNVRALAARGMSFRHAFVSNSLCCPSRSTLLTGLTSGHTGVWTNGDHDPRWGGWSAFLHNGLNPDGSLFDGSGDNAQRTVALALQDAGYRTALIGKYLNHYEQPDGSVPPIPSGWSRWFSFVGRNGAYYDYEISDQGTPRTYGSAPQDYSTDVIGRAARTFLRSPDIQAGSTPFFLYVAPYAPHGSAVPGPLDQHVVAPVSFMSPAFNEADVSDKPPYVAGMPPISDHERSRMLDAWDRVNGALRDVDRWVGRLERALPAPVLSRTVIIFTSDNGLEWGDHRLIYKGYPYERSIGVPLIVAGPDVRHGSSAGVVSNLDITPTILDLAHVTPPGPLDGTSLAPVLSGTGHLHPGGVLLEHMTLKWAPSYCGLRTRRWKYILYRDGAEELYDLRRDPHELRNVATDRPRVRASMRTRTIAACDPPPPDWTAP